MAIDGSKFKVVNNRDRNFTRAKMNKPLTSGSTAKGRFGKPDFRYVADEDVYLCPAGERLVYRYTTEEKGLILRRTWTSACQTCSLKHRCTTGKERRITRWQREHPQKMH